MLCWFIVFEQSLFISRSLYPALRTKHKLGIHYASDGVSLGNTSPDLVSGCGIVEAYLHI